MRGCAIPTFAACDKTYRLPPRPITPWGVRSCLLAIGTLLGGPLLLCPIHANELVTVVLEDGRLWEGEIALLPSVFPKPGEKDDVKRILVCDDQLRRSYVDNQLVKNAQPPLSGAKQERILIKQPTPRGGKKLLSLGAMVDATPFDEFGRRSVTLAAGGSRLVVLQGITEITPTYVRVQALQQEGQNYVWDMRLDPAALDVELLRKIIAKQKKDELDQRLQVTRMFLQAARYRDALAELTALTEKFPQQAESLAPQRKQIGQLLAKQVLEEIELRRNAGQHRLVSRLLESFPVEDAPGETLGTVRLRLQENKQRQEELDRFIALFEKHVEQLGEPSVKEQSALLLEEMKAEISPNTLNRAAAYLRLADDETEPLENRLALAVSGWLLGPDDTITDLTVALSAFRVREAIRFFLREDSPEARSQLLLDIRSEPAAKPDLVAKILRRMKPPLDRPEAHEKIAGFYEAEILLPTGEKVRYWLQTPPEYDPLTPYPTIVTLNGALTSPLDQLAYWAGSPNEQGEVIGQAGRRGYLVLSVDWRGENGSDFRYTSTEHARVLVALRDAMRRFAVDSDRVYITGSSSGGDAAWDIALAHPDLWAGMIAFDAASDKTIPFYRENAVGLPLYFVGGELDLARLQGNAPEWDYYLKHQGYDATLTLYRGRGHAVFQEEVHRLFDWMAKKTRKFKRDKFSVETMRRSDRFFWWMEVDGLPDAVAVDPLQWPKKPRTMNIRGQVMQDNSLSIIARGQPLTIWISPEWLDFSKPMSVNVNGRKQRIDAQDAAIDDILEDVRARADRQHPFWIKVRSDRSA